MTHVWFYEPDGRNKLDETHAVCNFWLTTSINHVRHFLMKPTSADIRKKREIKQKKKTTSPAVESLTEEALSTLLSCS